MAVNAQQLLKDEKDIDVPLLTIVRGVRTAIKDTPQIIGDRGCIDIFTLFVTVVNEE